MSTIHSHPLPDTGRTAVPETTGTGSQPVQDSAAASGRPAGSTAVTNRIGNAGAVSVAILRISLGFTFLWAFLDKLFGLGFSTAAAKSWINGGSPTKGFLSHVEVGPLKGFFGNIAGAGWADWLFMLGLGGIGIALILGAGLRIASIAGIVMMALMWLAEFPPAQHLADGTPTGSTNPLVDYHWIYAVGLLVVAVLGVASTLGLGRWWASQDFVRRNPWLK